MDAGLSRRHSSVAAFLVVFLLFTNENFLNGAGQPHDFRLNRRYLESFFSDFRQVGTSPLRWKKKDLIRFSAIVTAGSFLLVLDSEINDWVEQQRTSTSRDISRMISPLGHGLFLGSSLIVLYGSGEILENKQLRKTALLGLESWIISGVIVTGLKFFIGRQRPSHSEKGMNFHPFSLRSCYHSFPSGHASSAFAVATTIADQSEELAVDILAYSMAALVALSRIHDAKHWISDVFAGAAIGHFVSKRILFLNQDENQKKWNMAIRIFPQKKAVSVIICF